MAHVAPIYPNFARGEVSPLMFGRIDIEQYPTCLDKCRNAYIRPYGCATRLSGTEFIANAKNNGKARLLKFVFSATDSYIIECGAGYFRFYQDGQQVLDGNNQVYEIQNSYSEEQLPSIQYVQLDDIIKLVCLPDSRGNSSAKPKELIRRASNDWVFRDVEFKETPYLDQNTTDITLAPSAVTGSDITITASQDYFTSSMVGTNFWIGTKVTDSDTDKDVQGYVKITTFTDAKHVKAEVKAKLSGTAATKLWGEGAFSDYRGYPAVVALYDGRLYYARTPHQPRNVYGSKPYAYETFTPAVDNEDDAGINIQLATNANGDGSDIKWMIGASYLLCGTYGGEFVIRGTGDGAITATDISARQRTNWGGEPVQPIVAGTFVHFLQRNGNKLRQFQYDFYYDSYKAVDVSIFSEHLLSSPIKEMALQKNPDSIIYLLREDGNVVMLTLEQDQSVQAWSLLEEMGAKVESIQTIPSYDGNFDEVYMVMARNALATTLRVVSSNPNLNVTNNYTGSKPEGIETVVLTYNGANQAWTSPDSTVLNTKLTVSGTGGVYPTTTYSGTKPNVGTITETLEFFQGPNFYWAAASYKVPLGDRQWTSLAYGGTRYITISSGGYISSSTNSTNWTPATQNADLGNKSWRALAYGNAKFIAVSSNGYISSSSSGLSLTWETATFNSNLGNHSWNALIYGGGKFIALGLTGYISTSTDGTNWTTATQPDNIKMAYSWQSLAYDGTKYVALDYNGYISTSTDGTNWSVPVQDNNLKGHVWQALTFDGSKFLALDYEGVYSSSDDGTTWTLAIEETKIGNNEWVNLVYDGTKYIALSATGYISTCKRGDWKSLTTGNIVDLDSPNYKITYTGTPNYGSYIFCTWETISNYVSLSDYDISVSGVTPSNGDTLTLTYTTDFTGVARYIERMQNPITPDNPNDWWYVRSGLKYDGFELTKGNNLTLSANQGTVTAIASSNIFSESKVGNRIRFIDSDYNILGEGTITEYTSQTQVTLDITTYFQSSTMTGGSWGISTDTLSGLDHLDGREVQVYADTIEQESKTVTNGSITIDDAFIVVVGLPYTSYITTMPMEAGSQNGTAVGKRKRISEMAIRVWNTIGVKVGRDLDNLYDTIYKQKEPFTGVIPNIKYNQGWVWDANITVEQSHPYPMNILSIAPIVTEVDK